MLVFGRVEGVFSLFRYPLFKNGGPQSHVPPPPKRSQNRRSFGNQASGLLFVRANARSFFSLEDAHSLDMEGLWEEIDEIEFPELPAVADQRL